MSSRRLFSWSRRQSNAEPYYKTGGLLSLDSLENDFSSNAEPKDAQKAKKRPSNLIIVPPDHQQFASSPLSSPPYNARRVNSTSNLMAIFNDMLRSPALSSGGWPMSASVHNPLLSRPRSSSVPSSPQLPIELPGSLLQQNQGFPHIDTPGLAPSRPTSQNIRRGTHPPDRHPEDEGDVYDLSHLLPEPLNHSKSVSSLNIGYCEHEMKSSRNGAAATAYAMSEPEPHKVYHRKALSDIEWRTLAEPSSTSDSHITLPSTNPWHGNAGRNPDKSRIESRTLLQPSPSTSELVASDNTFERRASRRDDLSASLTPTPTTARSRHIAGLETTVATQDQTVSRLHSQFSSLRLSHEAHVSSLADAHAAEVASLRNYAKLLEEQLVQRPNLHHASSNDILFRLDATESPSTPSLESSQYTARTSASSSLSYRSGSERQQQQSPATSRDSPDMESLKRKLSTTRRPSTADRNLLPELNQYKQNNAALQTQISSLMAKLNESKKNEKALKATLKDVEERCTEAESNASEAQQLVASSQALQNTIDHLENRLEIANTEKLDAQEELFNMRALKSPFDAQFPDLQMPLHDAHISMDTVFSTDAQPDRRRESTATLSKFIAHIEQLEDELKQREAYIADLESDSMQLRHMLDQVNQQCDEINLQLDIQNDLLENTKDRDAQIEQLRAAVLKREAVIGEKEKSVRAVERQLEHHKLLLQAEIRKHATTQRYFADETNPLPELTALATRKDIDRWIQKLNQRLQKAKPMSPPAKQPATAAEEQIEDLRNEIDFYVREIIYYKLDIRGYKSDIKKLNKITAQLGSYSSRASDLESDTSSLRPAPTPSRARFLPTTPEPRSSAYPSPALNDPVTANMGSARTLTPPPSTTADSTEASPAPYDYESTFSSIPMTPQTTTKVTIISAPHTSPITAAPGNHNDSQHAPSTKDGHSEMLALAMRTPDPSYHAPSSHINEFSESTRRPSLEQHNSSASTVRPVVPTSRFSTDLRASSPAPRPTQGCHSRVGSGSSALSYSLHSSSSRADRRVSGTSSTGIPFVMAMGSPHNPAIAVAAKNKPVTRPHKSSSATSRAGIDGTMASSTPLSSPTGIGISSPVPTQSSPAPTGHKRKLSLSLRKQENESPTTPTHSRSLSGGSIRTAIRWTKANSKEREKGLQARKDSIGMPQPLGSPLSLGRDIDGMSGETQTMDFAAIGEKSAGI